MVVKAVLQSKLVLNLSVVCLSERSFDRHKLSVTVYQAIQPYCFPQHNVNVIDAITFMLDTYLNLLYVWKYVDITFRSTAVVWRLHATLTTQCYLKLMKVTVHKFTVADSFDFSQFNSSSMSLRWDCASKVPFGKWRWLSIKMMLSFTSLTYEIVKPLTL